MFEKTIAFFQNEFPMSISRFPIRFTILTIGLLSLGGVTCGQEVEATLAHAIGSTPGLGSTSVGSGGGNYHGGRYTGLWGPVNSPSAYRVLPRPTDLGTIPASPPNPQRTRPMMPYAYGWFGPKQTPSWSRSFGTRNGYTQWTLK